MRARDMIGGDSPPFFSEWLNAMPFVPVENAVLVEFRMTYDGQQVENTLWFGNDSAPTASDMATLGGALLGWWSTSLADYMVSTVVLREIVVTDMTSDTGPQVTQDGLGTTGNVEQDGMPGGTSLAVSFRTTSRGRSFRGRNYIVGIPIPQIVDISGVLDVYAAGLVDAYKAILTDVDLGNYQWVIASRFSGVDPDTGKPIPRVAGVATPVTTVLIVDQTVDSQRRRLPGRGK